MSPSAPSPCSSFANPDLLCLLCLVDGIVCLPVYQDPDFVVRDTAVSGTPDRCPRRRSLTQLAAHMGDLTCFQIELSKAYGPVEWRDDIKNLMLKAGLENKETVFLFSDTQIKKESFLEDLNSVLNSGDVPNIYQPDELDKIYQAMRVPVTEQGLPTTRPNLFAAYQKTVRSNLHTVITMSPIGEVFRARLRQFPALVNCCTIDWFSAWPDSALQNVALQFLDDMPDLDVSQEVLKGIVVTCQFMHQSVVDASELYLQELSRHNYVTATSYLELLNSYSHILARKKGELLLRVQRLNTGLDKLLVVLSRLDQLLVVLSSLDKLLVVLSRLDKLLVVLSGPDKLLVVLSLDKLLVVLSRLDKLLVVLSALDNVTGCIIKSGQVTGRIITSGQVTGCIIRSGQVTGCIIKSGQVTGRIITSGQVTVCIIRSGQVAGCIIRSGQVIGCIIGSGQVIGCIIKYGQVTGRIIRSGQSTSCIIRLLVALTGLDKLQSTGEEVQQLQKELTAMKPDLELAAQEAAKMITRIDKDKVVAEETKVVVEKEEAEATKQAETTQAIAADAQKDLGEYQYTESQSRSTDKP
ncbi:unnamed protein product [Timema podura]|uniref:Dynein heavy chain AAA module D4 domain-containing protein n=1 Tax=Timema podura TaxID=61482 RepID=A0ABN7NNV7_TIMPD|nr:unnamed protein product [Timema podura]